MKTRIALLLLGVLASPLAMAEACKVSQNTNSATVPAVVLESCYEFTGVPKGSIDWSCSNESNQPQGSEKHKVTACSSDFKARCTAALTQESLANHLARGEDKGPGSDSINLPAGAQVVTYYYGLEDRQQTRKDCENAGGTWVEP